MKFAGFVILVLLVLLAPVNSYANFNYLPAGIQASHKSHPKASKLQGPYSVGGKHTKHNTYKYLDKKNKHQKVSQHRTR
jgi:hypothetical protein